MSGTNEPSTNSVHPLNYVRNAKRSRAAGKEPRPLCSQGNECGSGFSRDIGLASFVRGQSRPPPLARKELAGASPLPLESCNLCHESRISLFNTDLYPRFGLTSLWDTAAAQCVVEQAGSRVLSLESKSLSYVNPEIRLNPPFIVYGGA